MRLIDADKLIKEVYGNPFVTDSVKTYVKCSVVEQPTVDAVEVVRCRYCNQADWYKAVDGRQLCYCMKHCSTGHTADDFCSYGEREQG